MLWCMEDSHFEIDEPQSRCADCGQPLLQTDPFCALDEALDLCWTCAIRRGGRFDADQDRWSVLPDVGDLEIGANPPV